MRYHDLDLSSLTAVRGAVKFQEANPMEIIVEHKVGEIGEVRPEIDLKGEFRDYDAELSTKKWDDPI